MSNYKKHSFNAHMITVSVLFWLHKQKLKNTTSLAVKSNSCIKKCCSRNFFSATIIHMNFFLIKAFIISAVSSLINPKTWQNFTFIISNEVSFSRSAAGGSTSLTWFSSHFLTQPSQVFITPPGLEPRTFHVLDEYVNIYTTEPTTIIFNTIPNNFIASWFH